MLWGHDIFEWSGWAMGLVGLLLAALAERRARRERDRTHRVAEELGTPQSVELARPEPAVVGAGGSPSEQPEQPEPGPPPRALPSEVDRTLRSVLIQVAVDRNAFGIAVERADTMRVRRDDVVAAALGLRDRKLLRFDDPLTDETVLRLT